MFFRKSRFTVAAATAVGAAAATLANSSIAAATHVAQPPAAATQVAQPPATALLGDSVGWHFSQWRSVTDAVRGGVSTASLKPCSGAARFSGTLDPSKLKAGFAGVSLPVEELPKPLKDFQGLQVEISSCDHFEYNIALKMKGARSGATHKFRFQPNGPAHIQMLYKDFKPTLRGRPAPELPHLNLDEVESLVLQIESNFMAQEGDFALTLGSVKGITADRPSDE